MWLAPTLVAGVLLFSMKETAGNSLLPVYGVRSGMGQAEAAIMLTVIGVGGVSLSYPMGWLADKFNRYGVLVCCGLVALAGAVLLPYAMGTRILLWPLLFAWGGAVCRHVYGGIDHNRTAFPRQGTGDGQSFPRSSLGCRQHGLAAADRRCHGYMGP